MNLKHHINIGLFVVLLFVALLLFSTQSFAAMKICNRADTTILVSVGSEIGQGDAKTLGTKGWWKIYPGSCGKFNSNEQYQGSYFLHSRSAPALTSQEDEFLWGEQKKLCVLKEDFNIQDVSICPVGSYMAAFNEIQANWKSSNTINIINPKKQHQQYTDIASNRIAGIQKMLIILGYPLQKVNGIMDLDTRSTLISLSRNHDLDQSEHEKLLAQLDDIIQSRIASK